MTNNQYFRYLPRIYSFSSIYIIFGFLLINCCNCSFVTVGKCKEKRSENPIDIRGLAGVWYELERWSNMEEWLYKCVSVKIDIFFEMKSEATWSSFHRYSGNVTMKTCSIRTTSDENDGKLILNSSEFSNQPNISIQVLQTDYKHMAIIWSCNDYKHVNAHSEGVWVFTREREPSEEILTKIEDAVETLNLESRKFYEVPQSGCDASNI